MTYQVVRCIKIYQVINGKFPACYRAEMFPRPPVSRFIRSLTLFFCPIPFIAKRESVQNALDFTYR